ncbi:MAG: head decoration protein [Betaproteobacteria bacterium]|nr:head decoration protein [Betaproteobacteria bacterium]
MAELASIAETTFNPDRLIAGPADLILTRQITLISGQNLTRGAVLGKITASGKYNLSLSAAGDGSQTPDAILAEDCNASGGDKVTIAYFKGRFNEDRLTFGTAHTAASTQEGLRAKGIDLVKPVAA